MLCKTDRAQASSRPNRTTRHISDSTTTLWRKCEAKYTVCPLRSWKERRNYEHSNGRTISQNEHPIAPFTAWRTQVTSPQLPNRPRNSQSRTERKQRTPNPSSNAPSACIDSSTGNRGIRRGPCVYVRKLFLRKERKCIYIKKKKKTHQCGEGREDGWDYTSADRGTERGARCTADRGGLVEPWSVDGSPWRWNENMQRSTLQRILLLYRRKKHHANTRFSNFTSDSACCSQFWSNVTRYFVFIVLGCKSYYLQSMSSDFAIPWPNLGDNVIASFSNILKTVYFYSVFNMPTRLHQQNAP